MAAIDLLLSPLRRAVAHRPLGAPPELLGESLVLCPSALLRQVAELLGKEAQQGRTPTVELSGKRVQRPGGGSWIVVRGLEPATGSGEAPVGIARAVPGQDPGDPELLTGRYPLELLLDPPSLCGAVWAREGEGGKPRLVPLVETGLAPGRGWALSLLNVESALLPSPVSRLIRRRSLEELVSAAPAADPPAGAYVSALGRARRQRTALALSTALLLALVVGGVALGVRGGGPLSGLFAARGGGAADGAVPSAPDAGPVSEAGATVRGAARDAGPPAEYAVAFEALDLLQRIVPRLRKPLAESPGAEKALGSANRLFCLRGLLGAGLRRDGGGVGVLLAEQFEDLCNPFDRTQGQTELKPVGRQVLCLLLHQALLDNRSPRQARDLLGRRLKNLGVCGRGTEGAVKEYYRRNRLGSLTDPGSTAAWVRLLRHHYQLEPSPGARPLDQGPAR